MGVVFILHRCHYIEPMLYYINSQPYKIAFARFVREHFICALMDLNTQMEMCLHEQMKSPTPSSFNKKLITITQYSLSEG